MDSVERLARFTEARIKEQEDRIAAALQAYGDSVISSLGGPVSAGRPDDTPLNGHDEDPERWMTRNEIAREFGVAYWTVTHAQQTGKLASKRHNKAVLSPRAEAERVFGLVLQDGSMRRQEVG